MEQVDAGRVTRQVQNQYEAFPYPRREPSSGIRYSPLDDLNLINAYCFGGRQDFRNRFRVLVAGGGTGDATVFYANQLAATNAQIVHVDLSGPSIDLTRARLAHLGLSGNVEFMQGSLTALPSVAIEGFDLINCVGVLHHLPDPRQGLDALCSVLKPEGALALMVYGKHGRTAVYQMQELLRHVNSETDDLTEQIANARLLLEHLPETNWYARSLGLFSPIESVSDAEIVDLFLHPRDRAFSVPELYEWLDASELNVAEFFWGNRSFYNNFQNPEVERLVAHLRPQERQTVAELYWGNLKQHAFWATRLENPQIDASDPENIPYFPQVVPGFEQLQSRLVSLAKRGIAETSIELGVGEVTLQLSVRLSPMIGQFVERIDSRRTVGEILAEIRPADRSADEVFAECLEFTRTLNQFDILVLRHRSVPQAIGEPVVERKAA